MLILISPSKTLDFSSAAIKDFSQPRLLSHSQELIDILKTKQLEELKKLMSISDNLAALNAERYTAFHTPFNKENAKQALLAFKGDVYLGLEAATFNVEQLHFAQQTIRILSGLYGLLRPLDLIQPYRLEMGTRLKNAKGKDLYQFWGDQITNLINQDLENDHHKFVINLASKEYFQAVNPAALKGQLINITFKENRNGTLKVISFNAKKARGKMARYIVRNNIDNVETLKGFYEDDYIFNDSLSSESDWVFTK